MKQERNVANCESETFVEISESSTIMWIATKQKAVNWYTAGEFRTNRPPKEALVMLVISSVKREIAVCN